VPIYYQIIGDRLTDAIPEIKKMIYTNAFLTLATNQWQRAVDFYGHLLAQSPQAVQPNRFAAFDLQGLRLAIYCPKAEERISPASYYPVLSICLQVPSLAQSLIHLQSLNLDPGDVQNSSHGREVYLYDPDGNRIIIYEPLRS
jgi:catechol 2,3-dioxygenase-like lactoylglutathione lyase family enzyme